MMGMTGGITSAIGGASMLAGQFLKANAAKMAKRRMQAVADTPGLDLNTITADALAREGANLPAAQALSASEATGRQSLTNQLIEQSMPGFTAARNAGTASANDLIAGKIPNDITDLVQRNSAARALGGGYGGSGMHRNLVGRDLGLTSIGMKSQGMQWLQALRGMSPAVAPQNALSMTGPSASEETALRERERLQKLQMLWSIAQAPGKTGSWGNAMWDAGAMLVGSGMGGGGGGFGATGSGGTASVGMPTGSNYTGTDWSDKFISSDMWNY